MSQKLLLKWNNHMNVMNEFKHFLSSETMIDVTLACDGQTLKAHKIVLSACSSFFKSLFLENPCKHPIVILNDVKYTELKAIIDFMYCGEVNVEANQVTSLVKIAQSLKVNGLGEVECENDHFSYESENPSGDESDNESINESVCTLDVHNGSFMEEQRMIDQNSNENATSEIVILENPEIKEELPEYRNRSVPCSSASKVPLQSHGTLNRSKSEKDMPNLKEQTLITSGLTRLSLQSSVQSNKELHQNHSDSTPNLISITPTRVSPGQSFQSSVHLNMEQHQNHSDNMPSLVSVTPTRMSPSQSFQSSAESSIKQNKNHSDNLRGLFSVTSTHVSRGQLLQSSAQSNKKLHQNQSDNMRSLTWTRVSQRKSFQSSALSNMELNKNHSDNMPGSLTVTATHTSQGQPLQSSAQSKMKPNKNHSDNIPGSLSVTSTCVSRGQSAQSNKEQHQNHSGNIVRDLFNMPGSITVTATHMSQGQPFQSSPLSNMKPNKNHSDNIPGSLSVTSTHVSQRQSLQSSAQSNMELDQNHSDNMPSSVSVTSTRVSSNAPANDSQQPSTSSEIVRNRLLKRKNISVYSDKLVSPITLRKNDSLNFKIKNLDEIEKKKMNELASGKKPEKKMMLRKLPIRKPGYFASLLQTEMEENEVYEPHNLRKPEVFIITECHSKKGCGKITDSRKTFKMKKCCKKQKKN